MKGISVRENGYFKDVQQKTHPDMKANYTFLGLHPDFKVLSRMLFFCIFQSKKKPGCFISMSLSQIV